MTSTALVKAEIKRFLSSDTPEVLCISGRWGVGKTYTWEKLLDEAKAETSVSMHSYAYVSLFGINSLEDLKLSIFENTAVLVGAETTDPLARTKTNTNWVLKVFKKNREIIAELPGIGNIVKSAGPLFFSSVRKQIVCIDDLERAGDGLNIRDVLGLVSFLKEQRKCKVVLLLNDDALGDQSEDFRTYSEKVIDADLKFAPTPSDSVDIALKQDSPASRRLAVDCSALGIANIRIIKRIERLVRMVEPRLEKYRSEVLHQAVHSLALFGWSRFGFKSGPPIPPTTAFLLGRTRYDLKPAENMPPEEAAWTTLLETYGFMACDEFDTVLLAGVQNGFFDFDALAAAAVELNAKFELASQDGSFERAWRKYHDSLKNDEEQVLEELSSSFKRNVQSISTTNLNGTISLFKELGRTKEATELIAYFVSNRKGDRKFWDLNQNTFAESVTDEEVRKALNEKLATFPDDTLAPKEILLKLGRNDDWNDRDLSALAASSPEVFANIFRESDGEELRTLLRGAFFFDKTAGISPNMQKALAHARSALTMLGRESPINARRVRRYGINVAIEQQKAAVVDSVVADQVGGVGDEDGAERAD